MIVDIYGEGTNDEKIICHIKELKLTKSNKKMGVLKMKNQLLETVNITINEILESETLYNSQCDNLKYHDENENIRIWVSRMGIEDGAKCNNEITVEKSISGDWEVIEAICPTNE